MKPHLNLLLFWLPLSLLFVLSTKPRPSPWLITHFFGTKLQFSPPDPNDLITPARQNYTLTVSLPQSNYFRYRFYYRCAFSCQEITLSIPTLPDPLNLTVYDPILINHPYYRSDQHLFSLYTHPSIIPPATSLDSLNPSYPLYAESYLKKKFLFPQPNPLSWPSSSPPSAPHYLASTFSPPRLFGDYFEFNQLIYYPDPFSQPIFLSLTHHSLDPKNYLYLSRPEIIAN